MEVRPLFGERRRRRSGGLTIAGPLAFLMVIWAGGYFTWRLVHGDREPPGVVTRVIYPDNRMGRIAHGLFMPLRRLDARYLGVESRLGATGEAARGEAAAAE